MQSWEFPFDSPSSTERVWFSRRKETDPWLPLRKSDCKALNENPDGLVPIEGSRSTADLKSLIIKDNFVDGPIRFLTSAIWFQKHYKSDKEFELIPLSLKDEVLVENLYQRAIEAYAADDNSFEKIIKEEVVIGENDEYRAYLSRSGSQLCMKKRRNAILTIEPHSELHRGYVNYTVDGEEEETSLGEVGHLIFVVHGIGESMWTREDVPVQGLRDSLEKLRREVHKKQYMQWKASCEQNAKLGKPLPSTPKRIEFIPVEWYEKIHSSASALKNSLLSTTIQTIPSLRAIANDVIFDVLMYMTPEFSDKVLLHVTDQICKSYERFLCFHKNFISQGGKCSMIGHSLGSVITWDILSILQGTDKSLEKWKGEHESNSFLNIIQQSFSGLMTGSIQDIGGLKTSEPAYQAFIAEGGEKEAAKKASWGPTLLKAMTKTIPFIPSFTFFLGSPLGLFLTLRGARVAFDKMRVDAGITKYVHSENEVIAPSSPFVLPSGAVYNIFHPSDPVAYRIEPLLTPPDTLTSDLPPPMFLIPDGQNVRLHVKAQEIFKTFVGGMFNKTSTTQPEDMEKAKAVYKFALGGKSGRVDYQLQPKFIDNEYLSAITAHTSYFSNDDIIEFIITCVNRP